MDSLERVKVLIGLAKIDGEVGPKERQYILSIGQANHLLVAEILPLFTAADVTAVKAGADVKQKEELLLELVQLMLIDERIYKTEMQYCAQVAARLGYREEVVFELIMKAKRVVPGDIDALRKIIGGYSKN